jgi:hypothetical protein
LLLPLLLHVRLSRLLLLCLLLLTQALFLLLPLLLHVRLSRLLLQCLLGLRQPLFNQARWSHLQWLS